MHQRYLRVTPYRTHPVVEGVPSVGPQAAQRQSGGLLRPQWTPGLAKYPCGGQHCNARHAGNQDQDGVGAAGVVVLGYGPQPVVEGAPAQGQALTTPKLRPSWSVTVASKRPLRWNST